MSVRGKFFVSSLVMLVLPVLFMLLISLVMLILMMSYLPDIRIYVNGAVPTIANPVVRRYIAAWIFIMVLSVAACCIGVTLYLSNAVLRPLDKMKEAMDRLTEGDLDYEFVCGGSREIREVYDSIEKLRRRLKKSVSDGLRREEQQRMLIANISHDLKTPITSIMGYAQGIRDGLASEPEMFDRYLGTIISKAEALMGMVNNLSVYSRLGSSADKMTETDIIQLISDVLGEYAVDLAAAGIDVSRAGLLESGETAVAAADAQKLRRVFGNIISNTIKYRKSGVPGSLRVNAERDGGYLLLSFEDSGIGISEQDAKSAFDTFFRADPARNLNIPGNGLGLSISAEIIREHGGRIWMRPCGDDGGTVVYVRLREMTA